MLGGGTFLGRGAALASSARRFMSSSAKARVLVSQTTNPFFNLATEEWLFRTGDISVPTLYLWRNEPTVVIGRCQNPWKECNIQKMNGEGVHLARRSSGGGAVYQDLGNTNFTFLTSMDNHDKERNSGIIISALSGFGLTAEASGRNDLVVQGMKISGAAYRLAPPRALHHGTLLIDVDMGALGGLLNPNKLKMQSKGVQSVVSRVTNLNKLSPQITHDSLTQQIVGSFLKHYGAEGVETEALDTSQLEKIDSLQKVYNELRDDDWRFGQSPAFSHHIEGRFESPSPWGTIDVHVESLKGKITEARIFSDSLYPTLIQAAEGALVGVAYDQAGVQAAMKALSLSPAGQEVPDIARHCDELAKWLQGVL